MSATYRRIFMLGCLVVCAATALQTSCTPKTTPTWEPGSSSGNPPRKMQGPGTVQSVTRIVEGAHRARSPAVVGRRSASSSLTQGLNGDGGRALSLNLGGALFDKLYVPLGPLKQTRVYTPDAGPDAGSEEVSEEVLAEPGVILRISTGNVVDEYALFTAEIDQDRFQTGTRQTVQINGADYLEPTNLVLQATSDENGDVYFATNASLEVIVFTGEASRDLLTTLEAPPSDIKYRDGALIMTLLPRLAPDDVHRLLSPPRVVSFDLQSRTLTTLATLPADAERYQGNGRSFDLPAGLPPILNADGGVHEEQKFKAPTAIVFALTFHESGRKFVTSSYEGVVYAVEPDGGLTTHATNLFGISSITDSPATDWLYGVVPAEFQTVEDMNTGVVTTSYVEYPRLIGISPTGEVIVLTTFSEYENVDITKAKNGFTTRVGDRDIGIAQLQTILADQIGNLVYADPVLGSIFTIMVVGTDGGTP